MSVHRNGAVKTPKAKQPKHRPAPVKTITAHPLAMECALYLAAGDAARIRVIDQHTVIVRNSR